MGAMPNEPSMEEILSSIKRIIADEDRAAPRVPRRGGAASAGRFTSLDEDGDDQILELTEALLDESDSLEEDEDVPDMPPARSMAKTARPARPARPRENGAASASLSATVLSEISAKAARDSLENLSKMLVRGDDTQSNTLEGLVREMLRPMLKEWLDKNLPGLVETMVQREIDRISGRV